MSPTPSRSPSVREGSAPQECATLAQAARLPRAGALAINDVVAAAIMLAFYELVGHWYYTAEKLTLRLVLLNWFKMGLVAGFLADALKLGG